MLRPIVPFNSNSNYSGVKIRINRPQANVSDAFQNGNFNAVDIEVNEPEINVKPAFVSYPKDYYIPNDTLPKHTITPEIEENKNINKDEPEEINVAKVPAPNYTTIEAEKIPYKADIDEVTIDENIVEEPKELLSFKGKNDIEIVPAQDIVPEINIHNVIKNLSSKNYDIQADQIEKIIETAAIDGQEKILPYVTKDVFHSLIKILEKDTSELEGPSEEKQEIRKKIILNKIAQEKAIQEKQDMEQFKAPYEVTDAEIALASTLSPLELAERNKEFALYTIAILSKTYIDEFYKQTNNIVPFTDLPGISNVVNALKNNNNAGIKIAAIDAISLIYRDEYKDELNSILLLATKDENPYVAHKAATSLSKINN